MISEASVRRAINHLGAFGDTDLFPRLPEMRCFLDRPAVIAKNCSNLNIGQYMPVGAIETLTPKSWLGFRIAHQLTASDNVVYLAALLDCAPCLEIARLSKEDNEAFAYRFALCLSGGVDEIHSYPSAGKVSFRYLGRDPDEVRKFYREAPKSHGQLEKYLTKTVARYITRREIDALAKEDPARLQIARIDNEISPAAIPFALRVTD